MEEGPTSGALSDRETGAGKEWVEDRRGGRGVNEAEGPAPTLLLLRPSTQQPGAKEKRQTSRRAGSRKRGALSRRASR